MPTILMRDERLRPRRQDRPKPVRRGSRKGVEALELVLTLPILLIATVAVLEMGIMLLLQQAVTTAVIEGAREASRDGATDAGVAAEVLRHLSIHEIDLSPTGDARLRIEDGGGAPPSDLGNTSLPCSPAGDAPAANQVRVTLCVRVTDTDNRPVPNWLAHFGFSLTGRTLEVSALATYE